MHESVLRILSLGSVLLCVLRRLLKVTSLRTHPPIRRRHHRKLRLFPRKPVKPRIRRDSKIIENLQKVEVQTVDGVQPSQSTMQLRIHLTRMAELEFIGELARKNKDVDLGARVNELLRLERKRYKNAVKQLKRYTRMKTQVGIP